MTNQENTLDLYNLSRFIEAQSNSYPIALKELQNGFKRSHWMWFIFPQLKQLGRSSRAKLYGIAGLEEAKAYLQHPVLGRRLREVTETILSLPGNDAVKVFGEIDTIKFRSSMTLFDYVAPNDIFARTLEKYFANQRDKATLNILRKPTHTIPYDRKFTPDFITELRPNEIFVFGSNLQGNHAGGAARIARKHFGAISGQGFGLQGQSYAIPTMQGGVETIAPYVNEFIEFAKQHPELTFLVTRIGCGIAGFEPTEIAPLFRQALSLANVILPEDFVEILS